MTTLSTFLNSSYNGYTGSFGYTGSRGFSGSRGFTGSQGDISATSTNTLSNKTIHGNVNTLTVDGTEDVGFRNVPLNGDKTVSYTLTTGDAGKCITIGTGGSVTIPNSTFNPGDVVSVYNSTGGDSSITCSTTTSYVAGIDINVSTATLAARGVCTVFFITSTVCVITGNVA